MALSKSLKNQGELTVQEWIHGLQKKARILFYDSMMYQINDSLTSILATCDAEGKEAIPKIKQYIHRINHNLGEAKKYQIFLNEKKNFFDISMTVNNLIQVLKDTYSGFKIVSLISEIKAPVLGEQSLFEKLFLSLLFYLTDKKDLKESEILIELRQKNNTAMLTLLKDDCVLHESAIGELDKIRESGFKGEFSLSPQGKGVEAILQLPLQFQILQIKKNFSREKQEDNRKTPAALFF